MKHLGPLETTFTGLLCRSPVPMERRSAALLAMLLPWAAQAASYSSGTMEGMAVPRSQAARHIHARIAWLGFLWTCLYPDKSKLCCAAGMKCSYHMDKALFPAAGQDCQVHPVLATIVDLPSYKACCRACAARVKAADGTCHSFTWQSASRGCMGTRTSRTSAGPATCAT